jgi:hypothetical protein
MRGLSGALEAVRNAGGISPEGHNLQRLVQGHQCADQLRCITTHARRRRAEGMAVESDAKGGRIQNSKFKIQNSKWKFKSA